MRRSPGTRTLITGAARGIGAALARRLHAAGHQVALLGLEPELLAGVARDCAAPWRECDVSDAAAVSTAVAELVEELGGLDVVVANAGIARQWSVLHGDLSVLETTLRVNLLGTVHTLRAAGPHIAHPGGYALLVSSMAAAIHLPLLGAYSTSKAAVEALGDTLRIELAPTGARVGVAYFAELRTEMTSRGFDTEAARRFFGPRGTLTPTTELATAIDALDRGIARRTSRIWTPRWAVAVAHARMPLQLLLAKVLPSARVQAGVEAATTEDVEFTTPQPAADRPL
ncbi:SDR family NAD(P)-dependent oxidoreductase [Actinokineospora bangkokensis]|uniref:SDR family NAD(P)-dependent oxidoreductase n=1 Tax=Actinokineospora bangkokensis TaxID=1193682 RepID=UPI000AA8B871|nr:SDR family NAD(P)-dependent oxidoreductase [Actinokineospora bangkokensis]